MHQNSKESFSLPVKGIITSSLPSTLVDMDTEEVKQTCPFNEHTVIRREFIDIELALLLEEAEDAPVFPALWVSPQQQQKQQESQGVVTSV